eukprot:2316614-Prorocentrum_lima.AAC.1
MGGRAEGGGGAADAEGAAAAAAPEREETAAAVGAGGRGGYETYGATATKGARRATWSREGGPGGGPGRSAR